MRAPTLFGLFATGLLTAAPPAPAAEGLVGLLPETVPPVLSGAAVEALDDSTREAFAADLGRLYSGEELSIAEQRELLGRLEEAVDGPIALSDAAARERSATLRGAVGRRVTVFEAALDTLAGETAATPADAFATAAKSLEALEKELAGIPNGDAWLPYVGAEKLSAELADGPAGPTAATRIAIDRLDLDASENDAQREFLSEPAFRTLRADLVAALAATESEDDATETDGPLREAVGEVLAAVETLERQGGIESRVAVAEALDAARPTTGGVFTAAVRRAYFGRPNVTADLSERFLRRLVSRTRTTSGPVTDYFNGSRIRGTSTTTSTTGLDLIPSGDGAAFAVTLNGTTRSRTTAYNSRATIGSLGTHTFNGRATVRFRDGRFVTSKPTLSVNPSLRTTGISTSVGGLFAGIARRRAAEAVAAARPRSLARARRRVTERVLPEFERGVRDRFGSAAGVTGLERRLEKEGVDVASYRTATSSEFLTATAKIGPAEDSIAGAPALSGGIASAPSRVATHESAVDAIADGLDLAGKTLTLEETRDLARDTLERILGRKLPPRPTRDADAADDGEAVALIFAEEHPVAVRIGAGSLELVLRVGLKREGKEDVPPQTVRVAFTPSFEGSEIVFTPGNPIVAPYGEVVSRVRQLGRSAAIRKRFEDRLEPIRVDRNVDLGDAGSARITSLFLADGWAVVGLDAVGKASGGRVVRRVAATAVAHPAVARAAGHHARPVRVVPVTRQIAGRSCRRF